MKPNRAFVLWLLLLSFLFTGSGWAAELPRAQLDESERYFTRAYLYFLDRDYWNASDYLERALNTNIYLVDYYLMKGLAMNRLGDFNAGRGALVHYLEVRPMDTTASRVLGYAIAQQRGLRSVLGQSALSVRWKLDRPDLQSELNMGIARPFNVKGMGKVRASESSWVLADTLGDRIYFQKKSMKGLHTLPVKSPAVVLPMGDNTYHVFTTSGDVQSFSALTDDPGLLSLDVKGTLEGNGGVADATLLSAQEVATADRLGRKISFYSLFDLSLLGEWTPPDDTRFFEPVAVSAYGPWLAVADRGNEKIYFLNALNKKDFFEVPLPRPRDVLWSSLGELLVINEAGNLLRLMPDFQAKHAETELLESGFSNGWALWALPSGRLYCLDISGSRLLRATMAPDPNISWAFLSVSSPSLEKQLDRESLVVRGTLMSPYGAYSNGRSAVSHVVWNNRTITANAAWDEATPKERGALLFNRRTPAGLIVSSLESVTVESGTDVQITLPSVWYQKKGNLTNLMVDSSLIFSRDELEILTLFCLNNGIKLDIWARGMPSVELTRAAALTGGKVVFSVTNEPELSSPYARMLIRAPLPPELSSSGFPSRSMLSVYLDMGSIYTRDWIPLWPDLLE